MLSACGGGGNGTYTGTGLPSLSLVAGL